MTAAAPAVPTRLDVPGPSPWTRVVGWIAGTTAVADIVLLILIGEVIPPLAIAAVVTLGGVALVRVRPRAGAMFLAIWALLWAFGSVPFTVPHLSHPESGIDFVHAVIEGPGRLVLVTAAVAAWRGARPALARRFGATALIALGLVVVTALVASVASSGTAATAGDDVAVVEDATFPEGLEVASGGTLFVDNRDLFRHTFTVEGTAVDVELPARQGVRIPIDLEAGTYELICRVPGHESMLASLTVTP